MFTQLLSFNVLFTLLLLIQDIKQTAGASTIPIASNTDALKQHGIIPNIINDFGSEALITATFDDNIPVTMGNTLSIT